MTSRPLIWRSNRQIRLSEVDQVSAYVKNLPAPVNGKDVAYFPVSPMYGLYIVASLKICFLKKREAKRQDDTDEILSAPFQDRSSISYGRMGVINS